VVILAVLSAFYGGLNSVGAPHFLTEALFGAVLLGLVYGAYLVGGRRRRL